VNISVRYDTAVNPDDVVNIVGQFDGDGVCRITDQSNFIVVDPDRLLSGTSVVSSVHCMRRFPMLFADLFTLLLGMYQISGTAGSASGPFWQIRPSPAPARFFDRIWTDLGQLFCKLLFRYATTLDYLKICSFISYWSLDVVNIKKSLIITGMTN